MPRLSLLVRLRGQVRLLMVDDVAGSKHSKSARQAKQAGYTTGRVELSYRRYVERTKESKRVVSVLRSFHWFCTSRLAWANPKPFRLARVGRRSWRHRCDGMGQDCCLLLLFLSNECWPRLWISGSTMCIRWLSEIFSFSCHWTPKCFRWLDAKAHIYVETIGRDIYTYNFAWFRNVKRTRPTQSSFFRTTVRTL